MRFKNKLKFELMEVPTSEIVDIGGIEFSNIAYVLVYVDGINLFSLDSFQDSLLVFPELKRSVSKSGKYLLFTGATGVADEAGWEYIEVLHKDNFVFWNIERDDSLLSYVFDKEIYINGVLEIEKQIESLSSNMKLEPFYVVHPE